MISLIQTIVEAFSAMNSSQKEAILSILLRMSGVLLLTALFTAFMPAQWMQDAHQWLGLGRLPTDPIVVYLTRSISLLYALQGALYILLSCDIDRYRPIIRFISLATILFGIFMIGIDVYARLPRYWSLSEGPGIIVAGCLFLWLVKQGHPEEGDQPRDVP